MPNDADVELIERMLRGQVSPNSVAESFGLNPYEFSNWLTRRGFYRRRAERVPT